MGKALVEGLVDAKGEVYAAAGEDYDEGGDDYYCCFAGFVSLVDTCTCE